MSAFKVGDRVVSVRGVHVGATGIVKELIPYEKTYDDFVRVKFKDKPFLTLKNVQNIEHAVPPYLLMDKGL